MGSITRSPPCRGTRRSTCSALALAAQGQPGALPEGDTRGFIVNVGGGQWYKNRPALLRIYAALRRTLRPAPRLLVAGKPMSPETLALARQLGVDGDLLYLSGLSGRQLEAAYGAAEALIFPSLDEGFGWPVAEAQACACPVFTSNRPPMTEVGGDGAVYFDPTDPAAAAATIAAAWPDRVELARRGSARTPPSGIPASCSSATSPSMRRPLPQTRDPMKLLRVIATPDPRHGGPAAGLRARSPPN